MHADIKSELLDKYLIGYLKETFIEDILDKLWHEKADFLASSESYLLMASGIKINNEEYLLENVFSAVLEDLDFNKTFSVFKTGSEESDIFTPSFILLENEAENEAQHVNNYAKSWDGLSEQIFEELKEGNSNTLTYIEEHGPVAPTAYWIRKNMNTDEDVLNCITQSERYIGAQLGTNDNPKTLLKNIKIPSERAYVLREFIKNNNQRKLIADVVFESSSDLSYAIRSENYLESMRMDQKGTSYSYVVSLKNIERLLQINNILLTKLLKQISHANYIQAELLRHITDQEIKELYRTSFTNVSGQWK